MAGYIRQDTSNNISNTSVIDADDLDAEFDALATAFNTSTGHTHDGSSAEGAPITVVGPAQDIVVSASAVTPKTDNTYDLGSASASYKTAYVTTITADSGTVAGVAITTASNTQTLSNKTINFASNTVRANSSLLRDALDGSSTGVGVAVFGTSPTIASPDIDGGTIDDVVIGGTTPDAGTFTSLAATSITLDGTALTPTAAQINKLADITATASEINKLDGVTATTLEINKLDGILGFAVGTVGAQSLADKTLISPAITGNVSGDALATSAEAEAGSSTTQLMTPATTKDAIEAIVPDVLNASGSAPIFGCRAWVNFDGTGTLSVGASGNVSSVVDNGTGDYTVFFTTNLGDTNYSVSFGNGYESVGDNSTAQIISQGLNSFRFVFVKLSDPSVRQDQSIVNAQVFR